jgi:hypothetical protein
MARLACRGRGSSPGVCVGTCLAIGCCVVTRACGPSPTWVAPPVVFERAKSRTKPSPVPCQVPYRAKSRTVPSPAQRRSCGPATTASVYWSLGSQKRVEQKRPRDPLLRRVGDGATVDFDEGLKVARGWSVGAVFVPRFAARLLLLAKTALKSWADGRPKVRQSCAGSKHGVTRRDLAS